MLKWADIQQEVSPFLSVQISFNFVSKVFQRWKHFVSHMETLCIHYRNRVFPL